MGDVESIKDVLDPDSESLKEGHKPCGYAGCDGVITDYKCDTCGKAPLGGKRPGSGFPQGQKKHKTIDKIKANEHFRQRTLRHLDRLYNAQMQLAIGEQSLYVKVTERDSKGKVTRVYHDIVRDESVIKQYLDFEQGINGAEDPSEQDEYYYLSVKPANNQALDSLLNRALGKAPDKLEVEGGFFTADKLIIEVVGSKHDDIEFGSDGQVSTGEDNPEADPVGTPKPGSDAPEPSAGS